MTTVRELINLYKAYHRDYVDVDVEVNYDEYNEIYDNMNVVSFDVQNLEYLDNPSLIIHVDENEKSKIDCEKNNPFD